MVTHYYLVSILNLYLKGVIIHILFSMFLREMLIARNNVQYIMVGMYPLLLHIFFSRRFCENVSVKNYLTKLFFIFEYMQ